MTTQISLFVGGGLLFIFGILPVAKTGIVTKKNMVAGILGMAIVLCSLVMFTIDHRWVT